MTQYYNRLSSVFPLNKYQHNTLTKTENEVYVAGRRYEVKPELREVLRAQPKSGVLGRFGESFRKLCSTGSIASVAKTMTRKLFPRQTILQEQLVRQRPARPARVPLTIPAKQPSASNGLLQNPQSSPSLATYRVITRSTGDYAQKIQEGNLVADKGGLLTSIEAPNNAGPGAQDKARHVVYFRIEGVGSPQPKGSNQGAVVYAPGAVFKVKAISSAQEHRSTYVWLQQVSAPEAGVVKDLYSGEQRVL